MSASSREEKHILHKLKHNIELNSTKKNSHFHILKIYIFEYRAASVTMKLYTFTFIQ